MPRPKKSCTTVQSTVDFPVRKTRSQVGSKHAIGLPVASRKRTERVAGIGKLEFIELLPQNIEQT